MTTIYFATNRNPLPKDSSSIDDFGDSFPEKNLGDLRFGSVRFIDEKLEKGTIQVLPDKPEEGSKALLAELRQKMKNDSLDSLIFIHGFNVTFQGAITSAAKFSNRLLQMSEGKYNPNIFVFSWPSNGKLFDYKDDRNDARTSGYAFARGLLKLSDFLRESTPQENCNQRINLIAHSMGNYVLRNALQEAQIINGNSLLPRIFDNIVLAAADEDNDAFEHTYKLARLTELTKSITVYFNTEDRALDISDLTKSNPERLGSSGPRNPLQLPGKVAVVDVSDVLDELRDISKFSALVEHDYHVQSDRVVRDLIAVFQNKKADSIDSRTYIPYANKFRLENKF